MIGYNLAFQPDQDPTDNRNEDLKKIHQFIVDWAETYYGKQFLVQLPYVCYRTDSDSGQVIYSENDELVTKESINELDNRIKSQKGVEVIFSKIKGANHFFKNKEKELKTEIEKYIKDKTALI